MNKKEEMLKEFWRIYFENITRKGEALPLFEWFWKHLEQREANFKASLKSEIEKEINSQPKFKDRSMAQDNFVAGLRKTLHLLDTVKPSTSQPEGNTVNK